MRILRTGHPIADTLADALERGLYGVKSDWVLGYGILRGNGDVFRDSEKTSWFNLDRGYFKPHHFDGYYRISLRGTQQTFGLYNLKRDWERLKKLDIEFPYPYRINGKAHTLIVPPTEHVVEFFNLQSWNPGAWDGPVLWRHKGCERPLEEDLTNCLRIVTFNSAIGWEALRRGIPVYSDPEHSIVGAWQKIDDRPLHLDLKRRQELFAIMSGLQLTLEEIRAGEICRVVEALLSLSQYSSAGTAERLSPVM